MARLLSLVGILSVLVTGCAGLLLNDSDSGGTKAAKVLTRVVLAVPTLGISEVSMAMARQQSDVNNSIAAYRAKIEECRQGAMYASSEQERLMWQAEYERYSRELESYLSYVRSAQAQQANAMRQAGQAMQQQGYNMMQEGMRPAPQPTIPQRKVVTCDTSEVFGGLRTTCEER